MSDYLINVSWSEEDQCYVADIPKAAVKQAGIAKQAWLDAARSEGKPIPRTLKFPVSICFRGFQERPRPPADGGLER